MLKLLTFCGCKDPALIRLGTSGGIGKAYIKYQTKK